MLIDRKQGETILRIVADRPMVQRLTRNNDLIYVDLLNLSANPSWVQYDPKEFPEFKYLKIDRLTANQPNSKLVVNLKDPQTEVRTEISEEGRVLELILTPPTLTAQSKNQKAPYPARIVIDAGHGGKDHGAIREGIREKDLNLSLALMVKQELEEKGFKVYMTRSTDEFLPLPQITAITNQIHPDLFISIHHNSSTNPGINGIETYYYHAQGIPLAKKVHAKIVNQVPNSPDRGVRQARFYVINHTQVPAILCEVGYVSNSAELRSLTTWERKKRTASAISEGVVEYVRSKVSAQR